MIGRKNPSSIVYWDDIFNDRALRACSHAAAGLWLRDMLPIAASCESRPGYVIVEGKPSKVEDLAETLAGIVGKPADELRPLIAELVATKVVGIDRGYVFNRRMVKAHGVSGKRSGAGKKGAEATHGKKRESQSLPGKPTGNVDDNVSGNGAGKDVGDGVSKTASPSYLQPSYLQESPGAASSPDPARDGDGSDRRAAPDSQNGEEVDGLAFDAGRAGLLACRLSGVDAGRADKDRLEVEGWLRRGWHIDTQIEPAIRAAAARPDYAPPTSLKYFTPIIAEFVDGVGSRPVSAARASAPQASSGASPYGRPWDKIVGDYKTQKAAFDAGTRPTRPFWIGDWGPRPDESGAHVPREILIKHGFRSADA